MEPLSATTFASATVAVRVDDAAVQLLARRDLEVAEVDRATGGERDVVELEALERRSDDDDGERAGPQTVIVKRPSRAYTGSEPFTLSFVVGAAIVPN